MSLGELHAYARRHRMSVRLSIDPCDPQREVSKLSALALHLGPGKDADLINAILLGNDPNLDKAAASLLASVKRKRTTAEG